MDFFLDSQGCLNDKSGNSFKQDDSNSLLGKEWEPVSSVTLQLPTFCGPVNTDFLGDCHFRKMCFQKGINVVSVRLTLLRVYIDKRCFHLVF